MTTDLDREMAERAERIERMKSLPTREWQELAYLQHQLDEARSLGCPEHLLTTLKNRLSELGYPPKIVE